MLAALLTGARPIAVSGTEAVIGLPSGAAFFKKKADQEDHRRIANEALRNVTGASLTIRYELGAAAEAGSQDVAESVAPPLTDDEIVQHFMEQLDAKEIEESN